MCKVYNTVGSLREIKTHLSQNGISESTSINDLITFQNNYTTARAEITSKQRVLITKERDALSSLILQLETEIKNDNQAIQIKLRSQIDKLQQQLDSIAAIEKTFIQEFTLSFKIVYLEIRIKYHELTFNSVVSSFGKEKIELLASKRSRYQYIATDIDRAARESAVSALYELDRKKRVIDEINNSIYGAIGELKVAKELEQCPDDYILINDFRYTFSQAIHNGKGYIKSIQIDHLLISPAGIFIIETKNWSKESLKNLNLYSPVEQIRRTSFALFKLISGSSNLKLKHHWGERKIPIKNIIVLINHKPMEKFQYVKVLTLNELVGYIRHFEASLTKDEVDRIGDWLIKVK